MQGAGAESAQSGADGYRLGAATDGKVLNSEFYKPAL